MGARSCYITSIPDPNSKHILIVEEVDIRDKKFLKQVDPIETKVEILLDEIERAQTVKIGADTQRAQKPAARLFTSK